MDYTLKNCATGNNRGGSLTKVYYVDNSGGGYGSPSVTTYSNFPNLVAQVNFYFV